LQQAAKILNTEAPDLYVRQNPVPNAYTLAISGKKPFIVVHTSLVELLSRKELQVQFHIHFFPTGVAWLEFY
jgi:Zn-dependent protease with chaperone function